MGSSHAQSVVLLALALSFAAQARAQEDGEPASDEAPIQASIGSDDSNDAEASGATFSLRANTEWIFPADLDEGDGEVAIGRVGARIDASFRIADKSRLGISLGEEFSFYDFSDTMILPSGLDPIDDTSETSLGVNFVTQFNDRWSMFAGVGVLASAETGADFSDSLTYSGLAIVNYKLSDRLTFGNGVLVRTRLEEDVLILPVGTLDWKINDKWNLGNTGGSSGIRATLSYRYSDSWRFFGDAGFEGREFRLDDEGPIPDGIARDQRVPVALGAVFTPNDNLTVHMRAGAHFLQSLEFDDSSGDQIADTDLDPTGFISFMVSLRM